MVKKRVFSTRVGILGIWPTLILLLFASSARGQSRPESYVVLLASGFLCDPGDSGSCPAVAKSASGDTYEISGAGAFDPQKKSVKAAGTFTQRGTNGAVLETGAWLATDLISFDSYGAAPNALIQKGPAFNPPKVGQKGPAMRTGATPTGGLAIFQIILRAMSGTTKTAILQVNCALGDVPRERSTEGIRLSLEQPKSDFVEEVGGRVVFLLMRPEKNALTKP